MAKLQIDSVDLADQAFQPLVLLITKSVGEAFELQKKREELPRYLKLNQACIYMNCAYNTLRKYRAMGLRTILIGNEEKIDQRDADEFMEKHKI